MMDSHLQKRSATRMTPLIKQVFVVSGAALNIVGHGCVHGFPAVLFSQLRTSSNGTTTGNTLGDNPDELRISDVDASWIAAVLGLMGLFGNFISPVLMNRFGRQKTHLLSTIPALIGWAAAIAARDIPALLAARLLHGLSLGLRTPLAAILVAEYTDPEYRGLFLGTFAISLGLGIFLTHLIGYYLTWRMTALVCSIFPLISLIIIALSPESPSWLAAKGSFNKCAEAFHWLRGNSDKQKKELQILINSQRMEMCSIDKSTLRNKSYKEMLKESLSAFMKVEFVKPAIIAICMFFIFEFGGAHIIPAYANQIIREILGKKSNEVIKWQITTVDFLRMLSALLAIFLLKRFDRRTILFTSGIMTVISFLLISLYMYIRKFDFIAVSRIDSFLPMTLIVAYTVSFCLGLVPLTWVICGEIFPLAHRSLGSTFSTTCLTPAFMLSMKTAPYLFAQVGVEGAYLVYASVLTICLVIIYPLLPETRNRTLQEVEDSFKSRSIKMDLMDVEMKRMLDR